MEIDNPQLLPRTKGILVYGIYAHFLWLCHYTHTFVIDNPIFTKKNPFLLPGNLESFLMSIKVS